MGSKNEFVEAVNFILSERLRYGSMSLEERRSLSFEDAMSHLPALGSFGHYTIGRAAGQQLTLLAREAAKRAGLTHRTKIDTIRRPLAKLFSERFLGEQRPVDVQQVDRLLSSAGKAARLKCTDITHIIPCHLMLSKEPQFFHIGPILFRNRSATRRFLRSKIRNHAHEADEKNKKYRRILLTRAILYYRSFQWTAEVTIKNCDTEISQDLAMRATIAALDCIHLMFTPRHTDQMRVGGPKMYRDDRAHLTINANGDLWPSLSMSGSGQVGYEAGWAQTLEQSDYKYGIELFGIVLEAAVDPDLKRPISRRFLDAAQWFGEASRDDSPATKTVKFVTALERMVMTEEHDDITKIVSERVAALCFDPSKTGDRDAWRQKAREAYGFRSKLVHGSMSPTAAGLWRGARLGAELGRATLLSALTALGPDVLRLEEASPSRLGKYYNSIIEWGDNLEDKYSNEANANVCESSIESPQSGES